jgi:hypothetical protein
MNASDVSFAWSKTRTMLVKPVKDPDPATIAFKCATDATR